MNIFNWFGRFFGRNSIINIKSNDFAENFSGVYIQTFALFSTIEMIASLLSKIEYKTFFSGNEKKGYEWYSLNVKPNKNQNSIEFWQEFWCKLLYNQEVLVVTTASGDKIIADDYMITEYAVNENIFEQVTRGDFTFRKIFKSSDVIYLKYTNNNIRNFIDNIFIMYNELISNAKDRYIQGSGEKGTLKVNAYAQGDPNFEENFKNMMENRFKSYFSNKNAVIPLFNGYDYVPKNQNTKSISEIMDIKNIFDDALCRTAQIYKVSPALLKGEIAGIEDSLNMTLTACIDPLAHMISKELTGKLFPVEKFIKGNYIHADTSCIKHIDILEVAPNIDKLISCGFYSPDEMRAKAGEHEINENWSKNHYMTKNYQIADEMKGGENLEILGNQTTGGTAENS